MIPLPDLSHLLKYPNATVQYESRMDGWEMRRVQLTPKLLCWLWDYPGAYRNLRLVLRKLESLTEQEAKSLFHLAYPWIENTEVILDKGNGSVDIKPKDSSLDVYVSLNVRTRTSFALLATLNVKNEDSVQEAQFNQRVDSVGVVDYLRSLHVDLDGYIASGLAVEKEN